jgi:hypothetical protein
MSTEITPEFTFDDLEIIGASKSNVWLKCKGYPPVADAEDIPCVIQMKRALFKKALDYFLNGKAHYYGKLAPGDMGGAGGKLIAAEYFELPEGHRMFINRDIFRTFVVTAFDEEVYMEHG